MLIVPLNRRMAAPVALVVAALSLVRPAAAEQDLGGATALFDEAKALAEAGDHAAACPKFAASLDLDPVLGTRLNLADCYGKIGKFGSAKRHWTEALRQAKETGDERIGFIEEELAKVAPRASTLRLDVTQGAETLAVRVGGSTVSSTSWGRPIDLDAGAIEVDVLRGDEILETKKVDLAEGATETVALDLAKIAKAHPATRPKTAPEPVDPTQRNTGIAIFSVGLAGIATFGVLEVAGLGLRSSANDPGSCHERADGTYLCAPGGYDDAMLAGDLAEVGQWIGVGAVAVTAVGLTVFLTAPSEPAPEDAAAPTVALAPWFGSRGVGLSIGGTFR